MTNEEALKELSASIEGSGFQCHIETYKKAIEALEKQIPKKPNAYHVRIFGADKIAYDCPNCKRFFATSRPCTDDAVKRNSFCNICGQAILWEDHESEIEPMEEVSE